MFWTSPQTCLSLFICFLVSSAFNFPLIAAVPPRPRDIVGTRQKTLNSSVSAHTLISSKWLDYGDATCMKWTGGECSLSGCKDERGPTECIEGKCMCKSSHCANSWGKCELQSKGKSVGSHSIRFLNAYDQGQPYLGTELVEGGFFSSAHYVAASVASPLKWNIVHTPNGFVRLESMDQPGNMLTIYNNRRRRTHNFLQARMQEPDYATAGPSDFTEYQRSNESTAFARSRVNLTDDTDLWPLVMDFKETHPLMVSFQLRQVKGGIEIWDPQQKVSLASADKSWWFEDEVAQHGVAECYPKGFWSNGCKGRELVTFEPSLPPGVVTNDDRVDVQTIGVLTWWQTALLVLGCLMCFCGRPFLQALRDR